MEGGEYMMDTPGWELLWKVVNYDTNIYQLLRGNQGDTGKNKTRIRWQGVLSGTFISYNMEY